MLTEWHAECMNALAGVTTLAKGLTLSTTDSCGLALVRHDTPKPTPLQREHSIDHERYTRAD